MSLIQKQILSKFMNLKKILVIFLLLSVTLIVGFLFIKPIIHEWFILMFLVLVIFCSFFLGAIVMSEDTEEVKKRVNNVKPKLPYD